MVEYGRLINGYRDDIKRLDSMLLHAKNELYITINVPECFCTENRQCSGIS